MTQYHEPIELLDEEAMDFSRALNSLKEEIEAIDWYHQRVVASNNPELKEIMAHNRDEEIEHAVMSIEWLRRNMDGWDGELKTYLFTTGNITELEDAAMSGESTEEAKISKKDVSLKIGDLK